MRSVGAFAELETGACSWAMLPSDVFVTGDASPAWLGDYVERLAFRLQRQVKAKRTLL